MSRKQVLNLISKAEELVKEAEEKIAVNGTNKVRMLEKLLEEKDALIRQYKEELKKEAERRIAQTNKSMPDKNDSIGDLTDKNIVGSTDNPLRDWVLSRKTEKL